MATHLESELLKRTQFSLFSWFSKLTTDTFFSPNNNDALLLMFALSDGEFWVCFGKQGHIPDTGTPGNYCSSFPLLQLSALSDHPQFQEAIHTYRREAANHFLQSQIIYFYFLFLFIAFKLIYHDSLKYFCLCSPLDLLWCHDLYLRLLYILMLFSCMV